jgi:uracil-DNA glycosylase
VRPGFVLRPSSELGLKDRESGLAALHRRMRACRKCVEAGYAITPGAVFSGPVTARVLVVGQAPGVSEVEARRPFNGPSGRRLFGWLAQAGWEEAAFRAIHYVTAVTKCYPGRTASGKGDRAPTRSERRLCAPFLEAELALVDPLVIIPVGRLAVERFLGPVRLAEAVGTVADDGEGRSIVPLPHPSGASLWLNRAENRERVLRALRHLGELRERFPLP